MKKSFLAILTATAIICSVFDAAAQAYSYTTEQTRTSPPAYICYLDGNVSLSSSVAGYSYDVSFGASYEELAFPTIVAGFYLSKASFGYKNFANSCHSNGAKNNYAYCDVEVLLSDSSTLSFGQAGKAFPLVRSSGYDDEQGNGTIILLLEMDKVKLNGALLENDQSKTMRSAVEKLRTSNIASISINVYDGEKGKRQNGATFFTSGLRSAETFDKMFDTLADNTKMRREYFHYSSSD